MERSTADTKERSPVESPCRVVTSVTHDSQSRSPAYRGKEDKGKIVGRQKRREQLGQQKGIGPALETRQSHTIKYGVNQIVPERY